MTTDPPDPSDCGTPTGPGTATVGTRTREEEVLGTVAVLVDTLLADHDVVDLLTELTERCARLLGAASAGLLLTGPDQRLHLVTATSARTQDLELFQLQADEGPCLDCHRTGAPVSVGNLAAAADRWPAFVAAALGAGFASVHAVPMRAAGTGLGTLGLFGTATGGLDAADLAVGETLARVASVAVLQERAPDPGGVGLRLQDVLSRQVVVEQAKGFVHDRLGVPLERASGVLRTAAHERGVHLSDLCRDLVGDPAQRTPLLDTLRAVADRA